MSYFKKIPMSLVSGLIAALSDKIGTSNFGTLLRSAFITENGISAVLPLKIQDNEGNEYAEILLDFDTTTLEVSSDKLRVKNHSPATSGTVSNPAFNTTAGSITYGTRSMSWKRQNGYYDVLFAIAGTSGAGGATIVGLNSFPAAPSGYNSLPAEIGRFKFEDENAVVVKGFIDANSSATINFDQAVVITANTDFTVVGQFRYQG